MTDLACPHGRKWTKCETCELIEAERLIAAMQHEIAILETSLAERWENLNVQDGIIDGLREEISVLQSDLAAAREEIAMARKALIAAWAQNYYHEWVGSTAELPRIMERHKYRDAAKTRAEARYAREIAHANKGEEG